MCAHIDHVIPNHFRQTVLGAQIPLTERKNISLPQVLLYLAVHHPHNPLVQLAKKTE